jgi:MYXO-CTERM domain-containing protein
MSSVSLAAVLSVTLVASVSSAAEPRIFGGENAEVGDVPAVALIVYDGGFVCTGALIAPRWVLTAAHCVQEPDTTRVYFDRMRAYIDEGREVPVRRVVAHPDYRHALHGHDIGLIELDEEVVDREPLPYDLDGGDVHVGSTVSFIGYGASDPVTQAGIGTARRLENRSVIACATAPFLPLADEQVLCFDHRDGKGFCHGDSGGPVLADVGGVPTIVGINSFGWDPTATASKPPTCEFYGGATRTDGEVGFIEDTLSGGEGGCGCRAGGRSPAPAGGAALLLGLALLWRRRRVTR